MPPNGSPLLVASIHSSACRAARVRKCWCMPMTVSTPRLNRSVRAATGAGPPIRSFTAVVRISFSRCARFNSTRCAAMKFEMPSPAISVAAVPAMWRASVSRPLEGTDCVGVLAHHQVQQDPLRGEEAFSSLLQPARQHGYGGRLASRNGFLWHENYSFLLQCSIYLQYRPKGLFMSR